MGLATICRMSFQQAICVAAGGGAGALARWTLQGWIQSRTQAMFPSGTLIVNLTGAFLIGLVMTALLDHFKTADGWRLLLVTGFLGGYTTFSALAWETLELFTAGGAPQAWLYLAATLFGGVAAVLLGVWLGRLL
jgi:CrcB protein